MLFAMAEKENDDHLQMDSALSNHDQDLEGEHAIDLTSENELSDDDISSLSTNRVVTIKIGQDEMQCPISRLKGLPYFDALFSDRWMNSRRNRWNTNNHNDNTSSNNNNNNNDHKTEKQQSLDTNNQEGKDSNDNNIDNNNNNNNRNNNNNNTSNTNDIIDIFGSSREYFGCSEVKLLLKIAEIGRIPFNLQLTLAQIDRLMYCSDFLTGVNQDYQASNNNNNNNNNNINNNNNKNNKRSRRYSSDSNNISINDTGNKNEDGNHVTNKFSITKEKLFEYIQNRVPSIDSETRREWGIHSSHVTFRLALIEYNEILKQQLTIARQRWNNLCYGINNNSNGGGSGSGNGRGNGGSMDDDDGNSINVFNNINVSTHGGAALAVGMNAAGNGGNGVVAGGSGSSGSGGNGAALHLRVDRETAALAFSRKLKFRFCEDKSKNSLKIEVIGFNKDEWERLIGMFDFDDYWHYFDKELSNLIDVLSNIDSSSKRKIEIESNQANAIKKLLKQLIKIVKEKHDAYNAHQKGTIQQAAFVNNNNEKRDKNDNDNDNDNVDVDVITREGNDSDHDSQNQSLSFNSNDSSNRKKSKSRIRRDGNIRKRKRRRNSGSIIGGGDDEKDLDDFVEYDLIMEQESTNTPLNNPNMPYNMTLLNLFSSYLNFMHLRKHTFCFLQKFKSTCELLTCREKEVIYKILVNTFEFYVKSSKMRKESDDEKDRKRRIDSVTNWFRLLQYILANCQSTFIVGKAKEWFPIFHEKYENFLKLDDIVNWVFDQIVPKLNTQLAFNFGLYLSDYATYSTNNNVEFSERYFEFLRNQVGITWAINPRSNRNDWSRNSRNSGNSNSNNSNRNRDVARSSTAGRTRMRTVQRRASDVNTVVSTRRNRNSS